MTFRPCVIIPCYNHGKFIAAVIKQIQFYNLPIIVVDDCSDLETRTYLQELQQEFNFILHHHSQNLGKGGAVKTGLYLAEIEGFTHSLQIDADGQHNLTDIPIFLDYGRKYPNALISAQPQYDESVPKSRYYGRYLTHIWVWLETLSFQVKDSLCGFRLYPVQATLSIIRHCFVGNRMDFDIEIMVQYYWRERQVYFIPSKVIYPENGISHFDQLYDNLRLSRMHIRLLCQWIKYIPSLLWRKQPKYKKNDLSHWSNINETGSRIGIKSLLAVYSLLGKKGFRILLKPVIWYYWLFAKKHRNASEKYLSYLKDYCQQHQLELNQTVKLTSFNHLSYFAEAMLNKIIAWRGDIKLSDIQFYLPPNFNKEELKGSLVIGSHLGDLELSRALSQTVNLLKITAIVFTQHALRFNQILQEYQPKNTELELLQVSQISPATILLLQQRIEQGHMIVIVGDRTSPNQINNNQHQTEVDFLDHSASFAHGPYILAHLLKCPVYTLFVLRDKQQDGKFNFYLDKFADKIELPRNNRNIAIKPYITQYVERLTYYCRKSPLEWFNFFDFWHKDKK